MLIIRAVNSHKDAVDDAFLSGIATVRLTRWRRSLFSTVKGPMSVRWTSVARTGPDKGGSHAQAPNVMGSIR